VWEEVEARIAARSVGSTIFFGVVGADFLENVGGHAAVEMEKQGGVESEDEAFVGGNVSAFLDGLRLDGELVHGFERIDDMDSFVERFTGDPAEEGEDANVAGGNRDNAGEEEDQAKNGGGQDKNFGTYSLEARERGHVAARTEIDGVIWHNCLR